MSIIEESGGGTPYLYRYNISSSSTSFIFPNLRPEVTYRISIDVITTSGQLIPFDNLKTETVSVPPISWPQLPNVQIITDGKVTVSWEMPRSIQTDNDVNGFIIVYKLINETRYEKAEYFLSVYLLLKIIFKRKENERLKFFFLTLEKWKSTATPKMSTHIFLS